MNCEPSTVVASRQCIVTLDLLKAAPYSLVVLDPVELQVIAVNEYGQSAASDIGSGAII